MCCCSLGGFITSGPDQVMVVSGWGYTEDGFQFDILGQGHADADGTRERSI